jgi:TolB-like protein/tetratricopeptide (TPR) repeat protein
MAVPSGSRLGPYEIVAPLGAGGMGEVYRARDARLGRDVAVKLLPQAVANDPGRLTRFEQEARALAQLSHPSILSIFDFGKTGETVYAVMELLEGETLRERLIREKYSWRRAVEVATAIADGLASAHGAGIIHRDIKPENIFLTRDGRVKILDFGLARTEPAQGAQFGTLSLKPEGTQPGAVLGTVGYMAPEQVRGETADGRTDIFALGCVLFEMLTGQRAFRRDTAAETMAAILKDPVPEVAVPGTDVSSELDCIVGHCLEKNPAERFQSASDLAFSLREVAKPGAHAAPVLREKKRRWPKAWMILAALLVLAGAALLWQRGSVARRGGGVSGAIERIAVLPFENLGSPDDAYFVAGITDDIMERLMSVHRLAVVSRASCSHYAGTAKSPRQIGGELDVKYLVTGKVRWARGQGAAERVRITPELVRAADDTSVWTKNYELGTDEVLAVPSEIVRSVISALGVTLVEREPGSLDVHPTANSEAYQAFLRGRFLTREPHFTLSTWLAAVGDFEHAVRLDPDFALGWAELAKAHSRLVYFRYDISPQRSQQAKHALDRARELAPASPDTHFAAGYYHLWVERDTEDALKEFESASRGKPDNDEAQSAKGELFRLRGDWAAALEAYRAASSLSPRDGAALVDVAETLWWMRRYGEADEACDKAIVLAPDQAWPYLTKVFNLWSWKGREAVAQTLAALDSLAKDHEWWEWSWFHQEEMEGRFSDALKRMDRDPEGWIRIKIQAAPKVFFAAVLRMALGDVAAARNGFEKSRQMLEREVQANPDDARYHTSLGVALAGLGLKDEAVREGKRGIALLPVSKDAVYGIPHVIDLAHIYVLLGETEKALAELDFLLSRPGWISVPWLRADPRWRPLLGDPKFEALAAKYPVPN